MKKLLLLASLLIVIQSCKKKTYNLNLQVLKACELFQKVKEEKMQKAEVSINFQRLDDFQLVSYFSKAEHVESAFRELIRRFQLPLYNHVRTMLESHTAADEVIQNIFVKI